MTRHFTEEHEWIEVDGNSARVGITDYAQSQMGDIVFVEVPEDRRRAGQRQGGRRGRIRQGSFGRLFAGLRHSQRRQ